MLGSDSLSVTYTWSFNLCCQDYALQWGSKDCTGFLTDSQVYASILVILKGFIALFWDYVSVQAIKKTLRKCWKRVKKINQLHAYSFLETLKMVSVAKYGMEP